MLCDLVAGFSTGSCNISVTSLQDFKSVTKLICSLISLLSQCFEFFYAQFPLLIMDVNTVTNVTLSRRGLTIQGTLLLYPYHLVFTFQVKTVPKEIWICYPIIERISKARGSYNISNGGSNGDTDYTVSHIRLHCKDFTYYSFDFPNDSICCEVFSKLSSSITRTKSDVKLFYAFDYKLNVLEEKVSSGWEIYNPIEEYKRLGLISDYWRVTTINEEYKFCPTYPKNFVVPQAISDNVLKHAGKFRSKQRIPAIVYRHSGPNGNIIARCAQPLVGINLQSRSLQDEKLIIEIFKGQEQERKDKEEDIVEQPHRNLLVDLRPITNAMAQHALGAGTENIDNYREEEKTKTRHVDKIFCNIDNIHVMRDSLSKLSSILNDLDKLPISTLDIPNYSLLQTALTKTQWLHRLSIILQSVDRITKSIHLNNTNIIIHCSDGWDRTSQVSALLQLCLDPYYRTIKGFMILIEKEWVSFGFKFATRGDHGGCAGAIKKRKDQPIPAEKLDSELEPESEDSGNKVTNFLQRAAYHIKNTTQSDDSDKKNGTFLNINSTYGVSSEKSPIFHQFLDTVYQILRQHPSKFEFNSRFLKRLFYHYYSCQYGSFLCDSEKELREVNKVQDGTTSVWDYFNSRPLEFTNPGFVSGDVLFFNFTDVKWWFELYGRSDEEMNGLSNSLDKKIALMGLGDKP